MNASFEEFFLELNKHDASIYKWVYAKEIDESYDERYENGGLYREGND